MLKTVFSTVLGLAFIVSTQFAHAGVMYDVSNATTACGTGHGLWTGGQYKGEGCGNYFAIDAWLKIDGDGEDKTGHLYGTAKNNNDWVATIDIWMKDWSDTSDKYKQEGGAEYDAAAHDFFKQYGGTITMTKGDKKKVWNVKPYAYYFQYGVGASAKGKDYMGASAWLAACKVTKDGEKCPSGHWDLNLKLTKKVPEPGTLGLLALGLAGLGLARRRR